MTLTMGTDTDIAALGRRGLGIGVYAILGILMELDYLGMLKRAR
jgi:hypothetical protein